MNVFRRGAESVGKVPGSAIKTGINGLRTGLSLAKTFTTDPIKGLGSYFGIDRLFGTKREYKNFVDRRGFSRERFKEFIRSMTDTLNPNSPIANHYRSIQSDRKNLVTFSPKPG